MKGERSSISYGGAELKSIIRLKQNLALPKIEPRPPCPPKVYQKVYKYLDGALPIGIRKSNRSFKGATTSTRTPSKHVRPDKPAQSINSRRKVASRAASETEVPSWVMPIIRHLCKMLGAPAAPRHIFAGVSSILFSHNRPANVNIQALIITIYILVLNTLTVAETEPAEYLQRRETVSATLREALTQRGLEVEYDQDDIDDCMRQVSKYDWTDMDWFGNIEVELGHGGQEDGEELDWADDVDDEEGHVVPIQPKRLVSMDLEEKDYLQAGLGTMMDDRVDYLSDAKRRSYERWKMDTLLQIDELEAREQEMDADDR